MPFVYSGYGLVVEAEKAIPRLVPVPFQSRGDVRIRLGEMPPWLEKMREAPQPVWYVSASRTERGVAALTVWALDDGAHFRFLYGDGSQFVVDRAGTEVWATWAAGSGLDDIVSYLLGPILGFLLRLRGVTCLHASAISVGGRAVAFLGPEDAGKSTTAAAFAALGHRVLSDDILALSDREPFSVHPGFPWLRLRSAATGALPGPAGALPPPKPTKGSSRYYLDLTRGGDRFERRPCPLAAIYLLDGRRADAAAPFVEPVPGRDGLMALVTNTFAGRLLDRAMRAQEFESLARLAVAIPLRRLHPHADPASLGKLCDVVRDDLHTVIFSGLAATAGGACHVPSR